MQAASLLRDMLLRRAHLALLLAAALTAMVLSAAVDVADSDMSPRGAADGVSFAVRASPVGAAVARLTGDERRDANAERTLKQRLVLLAVLAALHGAVHTAWRGVIVHRRHRRPVTSLWSPQTGRSPPSSLSIA